MSFLARARDLEARLKAQPPHPLRAARALAIRAYRFLRYAPGDERQRAPIPPRAAWSVEKRMSRIGLVMLLVGFGLPLLARSLLPMTQFSDETAYQWMGRVGAGAWLLAQVKLYAVARASAGSVDA